MPTMTKPVLMPQMGESIAEGTIVRWIKKVGDKVDRDEPLFEISTDKVDAEIPSPAAGVLSEIKVKEGETVAVNSVVATIGDSVVVSTKAHANGAASEESAAGGAVSGGAEAPPPHGAMRGGNGAEALEPEDVRRARSSPLVRRIAKEHHVDISSLHGSGVGGRVTKHDILDYLDHRPATRPQRSAHVPAFKPGESVEIAPMGVMRKKIAEHMVLSRRTAAHVHSVFEVNFGRVVQLREQRKAEYERQGTKLTFLAFIARAVVESLSAFPVLNSSLDGDNIVYKKDINLGVAVALDWGLIVPVVKNADEKSLLGLSRAIADLATRARAKQLKPEEVQGGTFTITNPGIFGAQFGMPIINQPQMAILGIGVIEKRAVVVDDAIGIRPMGYLTLGYDHRLIDGAVADQFLSRIKDILENFDPREV
jgi:pyruvate dehydrogenase E2 component (dihydrolipoyllysine-residue acetyltransferase)